MVDVHFSHLQVVVDVPQGYSVSSMTVDAAASVLSDVIKLQMTRRLIAS